MRNCQNPKKLKDAKHHVTEEIYKKETYIMFIINSNKLEYNGINKVTFLIELLHFLLNQNLMQRYDASMMKTVISLCARGRKFYQTKGGILILHTQTQL